VHPSVAVSVTAVSTVSSIALSMVTFVSSAMALSPSPVGVVEALLEHPINRRIAIARRMASTV
jgi:hypothetical protein